MQRSQDLNMIKGPGALSSAVLARVRPIGETPEPSRSNFAKASWMAVGAAIVVAGVGAAYAVKAHGEAINSSAVVAFLLGPSVTSKPPRTTATAPFKLSGQLKRRSSFPSEAEFKASPSYRTLLLAGRTLPLAIHCKDVAALDAAKLVLGYVSERDPYYAEMMARGFMQRQPEKFNFSPSDCRKVLPDVLTDLRSRV